MADLAALKAALGRIQGGERVSAVTLRGDAAGCILRLDGLDADAAARLRGAVDVAARAVPGVASIRIIETAERGKGPTAAPAAASAPKGRMIGGEGPHPVDAVDMPNIKRIIAVGSGKGGVGKSTVAANLAVAFAAQGLKVGLLDADIYGPSTPTLLGTPGRAEVAARKIIPKSAYGVATVSMAMMADPDRAMIWRGPMASAAMMQLLTDSQWGDLDVLIVDLPPGTGDIQLTMAQKMPLYGAVVVSTPQDLALIDARRAMKMFETVKIPVLGMVENMSTFICPSCGSAHEIFGSGGAREMAETLGVAYLGGIPLHADIRTGSDAGVPPASQDSPQGAAFRAVAEKLRPSLKLEG